MDRIDETERAIMDRLREVNKISTKFNKPLTEEYVRGFLMGADKNNEIPSHHYDLLISNALKGVFI